MTPEARKEGLLVQEVGDETIVYDQQRAHAHRLNRTAALVWRACDGFNTTSDLSAIVQRETGVAAGEELVLLALERLSKGHLLTEPLALPANGSHLTRRDVLRKVAMVGGMSLLIPVVQSMVAPTPAMAMSIGCAKDGQVPTGTRPCCPGLHQVGNVCRGHF